MTLFYRQWVKSAKIGSGTAKQLIKRNPMELEKEKFSKFWKKNEYFVTATSI